MTELKFADWDHRPAVLVGAKAFAVLGRGKPWVSVDAYDVGHTGTELTETAWRRRFVGEFGHLDVVRWPSATQTKQWAQGSSKPFSRSDELILKQNGAYRYSGRPTTRFGHVDVHREYLSRVLLGALAGNAEVRAFALSMGRNEIIAWISSLLVGIALMSAGIIALLESF
jgi:hypothetical protein